MSRKILLSITLTILALVTASLLFYAILQGTFMIYPLVAGNSYISEGEGFSIFFHVILFIPVIFTFSFVILLLLARRFLKFIVNRILIILAGIFEIVTYTIFVFVNFICIEDNWIIDEIITTISISIIIIIISLNIISYLKFKKNDI
ncbi:MAG: hypothetical protein GY756_13530 [bacterium]|nr:hypothetical protein [bacterium]